MNWYRHPYKFHDVPETSYLVMANFMNFKSGVITHAVLNQV